MQIRSRLLPGRWIWWPSLKHPWLRQRALRSIAEEVAWTAGEEAAPVDEAARWSRTNKSTPAVLLRQCARNSSPPIWWRRSSPCWFPGQRRRHRRFPGGLPSCTRTSFARRRCSLPGLRSSSALTRCVGLEEVLRRHRCKLLLLPHVAAAAAAWF
jgi:hypothetical protein